MEKGALPLQVTLSCWANRGQRANILGNLSGHEFKSTFSDDYILNIFWLTKVMKVPKKLSSKNYHKYKISKIEPGVKDRSQRFTQRAGKKEDTCSFNGLYCQSRGIGRLYWYADQEKKFHPFP